MFKIPKPPHRAVHIRMKIPPDATIVKNEKLTPIQIIRALSAPVVTELGREVKKAMQSREARFAESDLVLARLQGGAQGASPIPKNSTSWWRPGRSRWTSFCPR